MFTATLFTIAKITETTEVSINKWMDKENVVYIHTMQYCSAIKKTEILQFAATWIDLEGIMLREMSDKIGRAHV